MSHPRRSGGLGGLEFPLLQDVTHKISTDFGVLLPEEGVALRGLFIIDPKGVLRQVNIQITHPFGFPPAISTTLWPFSNRHIHFPLFDPN